MTNKKKSWFVLFLGMFIIPELLWSPVINFYYELSQSSKYSSVKPWRNNFLQNSDNETVLKWVIFLQTLGLLLVIWNIATNKDLSQSLKWLLAILLGVIFILTAFALYYALSFNMDIL